MVDPRDIRIVETTPGGARRSMTGPQLAEEEYSPQGVSSIGEAGAIDMTGVGEFKVCYLSRSFIFLIFQARLLLPYFFILFLMMSVLS